MIRRFAPAAVLALAACATDTGPATPDPAGPIQTVTYSTGPCFGACPVYTVTVDLASGSIAWQGERFVAVTGDRRMVDKAAVVAFLNRLQKWRPPGERVLSGSPGCASMATDQSTVDVAWDGIAGHAHLAFNYGCDGEKNRVLAEDLRSAPTLLPIADLIGRR